MSNSRRDFIRLSGLSALAFTSPVKKLSSIIADDFFAEKKLPAFGLQLYTIKEDMKSDAKESIKKVASFGYNYIESFEEKDGKGMFWGMTNKEFKKFMDDLNIKIISSHCDIQKDFERKAAEASEIGMKYLICPWKGPQKSIDDFKRFADEFNKCGEICRKNGIRFAYHNHDYSWKVLDGQIPQEVMMNNTDKELVDFEMDIYWVVTAGIDAEAYFKKYKNRFRLCHIKDRMKTPLPDNKNSSCVIGTGVIPFNKILKTGMDNGLNYFIVEQEYFENTTPLKSAADNAAYMRKFEVK